MRMMTILTLSFLLLGPTAKANEAATKKAGSAQKTEETTKTKKAAKTDKTAKKDDKKKSEKKKGNTMVVMTIKQGDKTLGDIELELFEDKAPISTKNFKKYVEDGFYNGTIFHRVIDNFMVQGGGFTKDMTQKPTRDPIENEATNGVKNERGTLAMARTQVINSATAQFFINVKDNDFLNHSSPDIRGFGYAVFGKVAKGMEIVDKIKAVNTTSKNGMDDVPAETIMIEKATIK